MKKNTIIKLTLLSTFLSLAMILLSYFGIIRYVTLYLKSSESYIDNYSKLPKANKGRVVISMTTIPDRINKIKPVLNSLLDQTVKVDMIALNIPYNYQGKKYNIPKYMTNIVNIFRSGKDYGEGTKLIPSLFREKECDTIIIAVNDDQIFGEDFVQIFIEESEENPGKVIVDTKNTTMLVKPEFFGCDVINREKDKFDDSWFLQHSKGEKHIEYNGNYKML